MNGREFPAGNAAEIAMRRVFPGGARKLPTVVPAVMTAATNVGTGTRGEATVPLVILDASKAMGAEPAHLVAPSVPGLCEIVKGAPPP